MKSPIDDPFFNSFYYRGLVINSFIFLEDDISYCLAEYFSGGNNKHWEFQRTIADRMTFEAKRTSLRFVMEQIEVKNGFIKTKSNRYKCADFFNELRLLNDQRNRFAHYISYNMKSRLEYAIVLMETRDKINEFSYTYDDIQSLLDRIQKSKSEVQEIYKEFQNEQEEANAGYKDELDDQ